MELMIPSVGYEQLFQADKLTVRTSGEAAHVRLYFDDRVH